MIPFSFRFIWTLSVAGKLSGKYILYCCCSKAWPHFQLVILNGNDECSFWMTENTLMEVSDEVSFGSDLVGVAIVLCVRCACVDD